MRRVVVASKNPDKIAEVEAVLGDLGGFEVVRDVEWPDVDETEDSLLGNALLKARTVASATGLEALADDTGLEVTALDGAPGVHTARFAGPDATYAQNVKRLLEELDGIADRSARFRTVVALVSPTGEEVVAGGTLEGRITEVARGEGGFGYDPVFEVGDRTLAEIPATEKNRISHRGRALRALGAQLSDEKNGAPA